MEDLIKNDATFELYHNSEGADILNNRTLLTYPSEKSSFQVFLGFEGEDKPNANAKESKPKIDTEKVAQGVTATAGAISSVGSTIQAFKGDGTKAPSRRKALKEVCGRKPLLKKNRGTYDKCVADYNAGKIGGATSTKAPETNTNTNTDDTPPANNSKKIIIGVVVVAVIVTAFIGYKKGWFGKKAV
jgi:hypothetical protein